MQRKNWYIFIFIFWGVYLQDKLLDMKLLHQKVNSYSVLHVIFLCYSLLSMEAFQVDFSNLVVTWLLLMVISTSLILEYPPETAVGSEFSLLIVPPFYHDVVS